MRSNYYQLSLIFLGVLTTALFGAFLYREVFPEYKIYQNRYWELEKFRSTYTGEPPPPFSFGIKQILIDKDGAAAPAIDRCTSCHVALQFAHFSPTKVAYDINGNMMLNSNGEPVQEPNEEYVWKKVDEKIAFLLEEGKEEEATYFEELKTVELGEHKYDVTKALRMHPLIGRETRPFEYHAVDEFGCTSCHGGNGRGLTAPKAHGPVFDGQYEEEFMGPVPAFTEEDTENDPLFARVFNHKPGHELLFQTTPIFVGSLMQAKCVECHQTSSGALRSAALETEAVLQSQEQKSAAIRTSLFNEKKALETLLELKRSIVKDGYNKTIDRVRKLSEEYSLPKDQRESYNAQLQFLLKTSEAETLPKLNERIENSVGSKALALKLQSYSGSIDQFIEENKDRKGSIFQKAEAVESDKEAMFYVADAKRALNNNIPEPIPSQIDQLIQDFHRGQELYISQACYACHRIAGYARGGVGPELTDAGTKYPWFLKESIIWPQADLHTSTMPNFRLDHDEVEDLMTFLLSQKGRNRADSETGYQTNLLKWETGKKLPWEQPINPGKLHDLRYSMTVFASEGCAACHRLKGFESNVGYRSEKTSEDFDTRFRDSEWFQQLIPEEVIGSEIVAVLDAESDEIDQRIVDGVREGAILEQIEQNHPELIESFYSNFKYAMRAKNTAYADQPEKLANWQDRVRRVLMMYVQEYGLGRLIGPRPNWSGIYRSDEWLIEHFRKPSRHIARSIMPVFPYDDSKFYALTYMLDVLGIKNRNEVREIWNNRGFDPEMAYSIHCSQCHGEYLHGNGPVSEWIYPIPKNLRNANFLRNFTRKNVINSIVHGVNGTPMPPWGEVATDKPSADGIPVLTESEIEQLVNWLFNSLLGGEVIRGEQDVPKWQYNAEDVLEELENEGDQLIPGSPPEFIELKEPNPDLGLLRHPEASEYFVALNPVVHVNQTSFDVFDVMEQGYMIKDKYYTRENIQAGQAFFELNCSVCHGIEADGTGFRAGSMFDAKPRMLTNFHWIETRDDLRLLRSLKYGVAGTSMTPWGDLTSSLQRIQLVIFIRSLSREQLKRDELFNALYVAFDSADQNIDTARVDEYTKLNEIREQMNEVKENRSILLKNIEEGKGKPEEAIRLYEKELALASKIKEHEQADKLLEELKDSVKKEKAIYQVLGVQIIRSELIGDTFKKFLSAISLDNAQFQLKDGKLELRYDEQKEIEIDAIAKDLITEIKNEIAQAEQNRIVLQGKIPSHEVREKLDDLNAKIKSFSTLRDDLISGFSEAKRLREQQKQIYTKYLGK